jgi:hypothetical protein
VERAMCQPRSGARGKPGASAPGSVSGRIGVPQGTAPRLRHRLRRDATLAKPRIDGSFVGNTPSVVEVIPGDHEIAIKKSEYQTWHRKMKIMSGSINVAAELEKVQQERRNSRRGGRPRPPSSC